MSDTTKLYIDETNGSICLNIWTDGDYFVVGINNPKEINPLEWNNFINKVKERKSAELTIFQGESLLEWSFNERNGEITFCRFNDNLADSYDIEISLESCLENLLKIDKFINSQ